VDAEVIRTLARADSLQVPVESPQVSVERAGQAAAGGLLLSIAVVELLLGFWAAGWHQRAIALTIACLGAAFLASGIAEILVALRSDSFRGAADDAHPDPQLEPTVW
jgi:hypothetical protein